MPLATFLDGTTWEVTNTQLYAYQGDSFEALVKANGTLVLPEGDVPPGEFDLSVDDEEEWGIVPPLDGPDRS